MAHLRLYAELREAAGQERVEVDAATVGEAIEKASERFGSDFARAVPRSRVWLNDAAAEPEYAVSIDDEISLVPPVAGGAYASRSMSVEPTSILAAVAGIGLYMVQDRKILITALVVILSSWVIDISTVVQNRGRDLPLGPTLLGILATVAATFTLGPVGVGLGVASVVAFVGLWAVASESNRMLINIAPMVLVGIMATAAIGSMCSVAMYPYSGDMKIDLFVVAMLGGGIGSVAVYRFPEIPLGDPILASGVGTLVATLLVAMRSGLDLVAYLLIGLALAAAMVAGRGLGSAIRTRSVQLTEAAPGLMPLFDGAVMAAIVYLPLLRMLG